MKDAIIITHNTGIEKSTAHIVVEIIEYIPHAVASTTIIKKLTGDISTLSFDKGEGLPEKTSAFDTFDNYKSDLQCSLKNLHALKEQDD